jgi:hypothetical protein
MRLHPLALAARARRPPKPHGAARGGAAGEATPTWPRRRRPPADPAMLDRVAGLQVGWRPQLGGLPLLLRVSLESLNCVKANAARRVQRH